MARAERTRGGRRAEVDVFVAGLAPSDLAARISSGPGGPSPVSGRAAADGVVRFSFPAPRKGRARLQVWPHHPALPSPMELGLSLEAEV